MSVTSRQRRFAVLTLLAAVAASSWCVVVATADTPFRPTVESGEREVVVAATAAQPQAPEDIVPRSVVRAPIAAAPRAKLVHVHGRVTCSGEAVGGTELSFYAARDAWRERAVDWAITDALGWYEVELPPDSYLIDFQDTGQHAAIVVVRPGCSEQTVDLVLPEVVRAMTPAPRGVAGGGGSAHGGLRKCR